MVGQTPPHNNKEILLDHHLLDRHSLHLDLVSHLDQPLLVAVEHHQHCCLVPNLSQCLVVAHQHWHLVCLQLPLLGQIQHLGLSHLTLGAHQQSGRPHLHLEESPDKLLPLETLFLLLSSELNLTLVLVRTFSCFGIEKLHFWGVSFCLHVSLSVHHFLS